MQQINVKNVHLVYSTGIQPHDLSNISYHPEPLDQGSRQLLEQKRVSEIRFSALRHDWRGYTDFSRRRESMW